MTGLVRTITCSILCVGRGTKSAFSNSSETYYKHTLIKSIFGNFFFVFSVFVFFFASLPTRTHNKYLNFQTNTMALHN